jgi:hypothetical protein
LFGDFRITASAKTAKHYEIYSREYIAIKKLLLNITGFEIKSKMQVVAFMVVTDENMIAVRDALKTNRGGIFAKNIKQKKFQITTK